MARWYVEIEWGDNLKAYEVEADTALEAIRLVSREVGDPWATVRWCAL